LPASGVLQKAINANAARRGVRTMKSPAIVNRAKIREALEEANSRISRAEGAHRSHRESFEDPDWRMAHRMLRQAGFSRLD
jgi:hypothetical protein